jgi:hypothetical protein
MAAGNSPKAPPRPSLGRYNCLAGQESLSRIEPSGRTSASAPVGVPVQGNRSPTALRACRAPSGAAAHRLGSGWSLYKAHGFPASSTNEAKHPWYRPSTKAPPTSTTRYSFLATSSRRLALPGVFQRATHSSREGALCPQLARSPNSRATSSRPRTRSPDRSAIRRICEKTLVPRPRFSGVGHDGRPPTSMRPRRITSMARLVGPVHHI